MSDTIYIVCEKKVAKDGLSDYIPITEYENGEWGIIAYDNLITLQDEREDFIAERSVCGSCIRIIPVEFKQYACIVQGLSASVNKAREKIESAAVSMKEAFASINRKFDAALYEERQMSELDITSAVKCIDERMCVGEQRGEYITKKELPFPEIAEGIKDGCDSYLSSLGGEF